jgi:retron-type reverse transcriptase
LIAQVLRPQNFQKALQQVIANKGSAGIDGLKTIELKAYVQKHREALLETIKENRYLPQPILGVKIPKGGGQLRLLGIPTVVERLLQQAVSQVLMPKFFRYSVVGKSVKRLSELQRCLIGSSFE